MITNQQADELLRFPKWIVKDDERKERFSISITSTCRIRFSLIGELTGDIYEFLWELWQGGKNNLKLSLHTQEDETKIGLYRVDFW